MMDNSESFIIETQDGSSSVMSTEFGVSYHSKYGAIQETRHVFIEAGLLEVANRLNGFSILEFGFGTGLNAFMSYLIGKQRGLNLVYHTIEAFPITLEQVANLNYIEQLEATDDQEVFLDFHRLDWGIPQQMSSNFQFKKLLTAFEDINIEGAYDLIYYDAFAPSAQPQLWETEILRKVSDALNPGGMMVTYCAKGAVKRNLKSLGLTIESLPGPPGKREMTRARK